MSKNNTNDENSNQKSSNDSRNENENHNLQSKKDQEPKISNCKECGGAGDESSSSSSSLVLSPVPSSINSNSSSTITIKHENNEENEDVFLTPHSSQIVDLDGNNNHHVIQKEETREKGYDEMTRRKLVEEELTSMQFSNQQQSTRISPLMAIDDDDDGDDDDNDDNNKQNSTMLSFQFNNEPENPKTNTHGSSPTLIPTCTLTTNNNPSPEFFSIEKESFKTSISTKASPFLLPSWIALSLTLDGRDKITKVIQYTSRLLGYYYEEFAAAAGEGEADMATATISRDIYYSFKAKKFRNLYKAMASSRKAYRFGRTLIELEKLKSMGLIHWIAWYLRQSMFMETRNKFGKEKENVHHINADNHQDNSSAVCFHPNTTFQNEQKGGGGSNNSNSSINQNTSASYPPPINLKRQISSNLGFKPSILHNDVNETSYVQKLPYLGKFLYKSLSTVVNEEKYLHKASSSSSSTYQPPPLWKILSSALKLLGLAGFWAGDNIAYLYSIGFLVGDDASKTKKRKNNAALFATKSYFLAAVAGLYLNSREWHRHRNGPIKQLMDDISKLKMKQNVKKSNKRSSDNADGSSGSDNNDGATAAVSSEHQNLREMEKLEMKFEEMKHKHFKVCLALLKSCCDVAVFSNNSGVDLHLKYRGRKMNEGFQCVLGVLSALTVIFNNYPSVKKGKI